MESKTFEDILKFLRDKQFSDFETQLIKDVLDKNKFSSILIFKKSEEAKERFHYWRQVYPKLDTKYYKYDKCRGCSQDWGCNCGDAWAVEVILRKDSGYNKAWEPLK